jgi:hypothetical protein
MFQDIHNSRDLVKHYKTENRIDTGIKKSKRGIQNSVLILVDFSIMVLTSNVWPFYRPLNITLSPEVKL